MEIFKVSQKEIDQVKEKELKSTNPLKINKTKRNNNETDRKTTESP